MTTTRLDTTTAPGLAAEPDAPARPRRRTRGGVALATLLIVLCCELAARALAPRLPEPLDWNQREAALIVEQMKHVAATEGGADVVFLGSSVANFGFEPDELRARTGLRSYNAALPGASLLSIERWTQEMVVPLLRPRVAVIAITSRDVNDAGEPQRENLDQYLSSGERKRMLGISSNAERVEQAVEDNVALVRLRRYLRRPASVAKELRGRRVLERQIAFGPHGEPRFAEADFAFGETPARRQWELDALRGFAFPRNMQALGRLAGWLRAHGVATVVVDMPVVEDVYAPYHPRGAADLGAYRSALRRHTELAGVPLVSIASPGLDEFVDSIHLNRRGARRLTADVAARLQALGLI